MARKLRAAAQAAAQSMRNLPPVPDGSDDEMPDIPPSPRSDPTVEPKEEGEGSENDPDAEPAAEPETEPQPESERETGQEAEPTPGTAPETEGESQAEPVKEEDQSAATPAREQDATPQGETPGHDGSPMHSGGRVSAIPRKRRIGRPPKNRPPDWDLDDGSGQTPIRVTTPAKRRRGRPAASGGRWARNRGPSHITQLPVDKDGNVMEVIGDEVAVPGDPEGDTKITKDGHFLGGREYRVRTFTLLNRGDKLYMLSTEPARCIGFRDSYLFFQKHKLLYKIIIDDDEKRDLITREIIPHSYKGRAIGVVTARSVFREFGAKIVVGGRKIIDDYNVKEARERGDVEGELAVPEDKLPPPGEPYNRNQFVAWFGASSVYHNTAPSVPLPIGKAVDSKKRKVTVTGDNWMLEHAREASTFNSSLFNTRRATLEGVYDIHTNAIQYPKIMQPTHARWERLPPLDPRAASKLTKGLSTLTLANEADSIPPAEEEPVNDPERDPTTTTTATDTTIFSSIPSSLSRRFAIHDTIYETPPYSNQGIPGPDGDVHSLGSNGLISLANPQHPEFVTPEILAELPPECKEALVETAAREWEWKSNWRSEVDDGARTRPIKGYSWFP